MGLSSRGVTWNFIAVKIPMSMRVLAKLSWYSTSNISKACLASVSEVEFVHSKLDKNLAWDSLLPWSFSFSSFSKSRISLTLRICMGVCSFSLHGVCGAGNQ